MVLDFEMEGILKVLILVFCLYSRGDWDKESFDGGFGGSIRILNFIFYFLDNCFGYCIICFFIDRNKLVFFKIGYFVGNGFEV